MLAINMKRFVLVLICVLFTMAAYADQLEWIFKEEAAEAVELLQKQDYVLLYCGCCDDDPMRYVKIKTVSYCHPEGEDIYYEVFIEGVDADGIEVSEGIDLAYTYINDQGMAKCVGLALGLECDPCVDPFKWNCPKFNE